MAEEGLWEPLVIIETGDAITSGSERRGECSSDAFDHCDGKHTVKEEEDKIEDGREASMCSEHHKQSQAIEEENKTEESNNTDEEQNKCATKQVGETREKVNESLEDDGEVAKNQLQVDTERSTSCEQVQRSAEEDAKQVCTPFFSAQSLIFHNILCQEICSVSLSFFCPAPYLIYVCLCLFLGSSFNSGLPRGTLRAALYPAGGQAAQ